jgi:hypothetical protein
MPPVPRDLSGKREQCALNLRHARRWSTRDDRDDPPALTGSFVLDDKE